MLHSAQTAQSFDRKENTSADMWRRNSCKTSWQAAWLTILSFLQIPSTPYMAWHLNREFEFNSTIISPKQQHFLHSLYSHVGKLSTLDLTSFISDNFPKFSWAVLFVNGRTKAVFGVKYLDDALTKSFKTSDYDYLQCCLSFQPKIK